MADETIPPSPPESSVASPEERAGSPSPSVDASLALDAVPLLDCSRSVSTPSSTSGSTISRRSRNSRLSDGGATVVRRRGYVRPQGTLFADSARNRDSVMSLGSIAHMQYYFARTGLLDGKGAQLAKEERKKNASYDDKENKAPFMFRGSTIDDYNIGRLSLGESGAAYAKSDPGADDLVEGPADIHAKGEIWADWSDPIMLPPTVSTYKVKPEYVEPLPDMPVLRRELKEALQDALKVLEETQKREDAERPNVAEDSGFYEIQGLHLLDIITLAIRAAKNYYTAHTNPQKLYAIKSEKEIRAELYQVLDVLKRMASRNFRGGIRLEELVSIITWIESIDKLWKKEEAQEEAEAAERASWSWRESDWTSREREREWLFMRSFDQDEPALPQWPESSDDQQLPNDFLTTLQDGQRLVKLHNALVARSKRKFHEIKTWHTDVAKPYRMAENLLYWSKAAELRWETILTVPALDIVHGKDDATWKMFDEAIFKWCQAVRTELTEEWDEEARNQERKRPPELKIDGAVEDDPCGGAEQDDSGVEGLNMAAAA
ncbi:hypothetical protein CLAFUW4_09022 [Fulvia fulva]|uniref:Uncharacterized protein n=1 Tax=Passalora fulva TaxID=5499 RepID=A0A9Q8PFE1_PASFU|nr:uncharacterized protein CLAFUR5_09131 [Fulvia fulva]KAK4613320.1 hypothetical protein CLAFUR4_09028 [Fulvia fulva]KAK4615014.1 hypothetical protein CLAFUR0_09020 [Fulvia fulva]UJO21421.1 hypothetical protein CLAFUR5_09131 [Fulvia fulva]WPV20493.1 hypothetical protein CLAFUW4_09022 [Fulvia fulva]WPV35474.1 hypothetical protein CLAFUW7_09023 [Fulvia fulva]